MIIKYSNGGQKPATIKSNLIEVGQVFSGEILGYGDSVYLKSFSRVIDLKNPKSDWEGPVDIHDFVRLEASLEIWESGG